MDNTRRIFALIILPMITLQSVHSLESFINTDEIQSQCPEDSLVNLTGGILDESTGFIVKDGYAFPLDSTWIEMDEIFGCACYIRSNCFPLYCPMGSSIYFRIYPDCQAPSNVTVDYNQEAILYSIEMPIEKVALNNGTVFAEEFNGPCLWLEKNIVVTNNTVENVTYLRDDGSTYIPDKNISTMYNFDGYCLCSNQSFANRLPACLRAGVIYTGISRFDPDLNKMTEGVNMITRIGMIVSIPFLLLTFIVYTVIPELNNIHGITLRGYVGCLLIAYIILAIIQTTGPISDVHCYIFAFTIYFSFLASFFWLNAMCFDIWWTFGGFQSIRGKVNQHDRKKYIMFAVYAFGCAIFLTGICMVMSFVPEIPDYIIRPGFGIDSICWFKTAEAKALYFYGPMGLTIICNIFFFVSTSVKIIRHKKHAARHLKGINSKRHDENKEWFNLYLKLFVVMGINWSMEIIAWIYSDLKFIWYVTDLFNALQGLLIFIIFICKRKIIQLLFKRFGGEVPDFLSRNTTLSTSSTR